MIEFNFSFLQCFFIIAHNYFKETKNKKNDLGHRLHYLKNRNKELCQEVIELKLFVAKVKDEKYEILTTLSNKEAEYKSNVTKLEDAIVEKENDIDLLLESLKNLENRSIEGDDLLLKML